MARLKQKTYSHVVKTIVDIATKEVKKTGIFTMHGLCRIKTRTKPATKAGVRTMFGKEVKVKAKPAKTVVKVYPAAALKKQICDCTGPLTSIPKMCDQNHFVGLGKNGGFILDLSDKSIEWIERDGDEYAMELEIVPYAEAKPILEKAGF